METMLTNALTRSNKELIVSYVPPPGDDPGKALLLFSLNMVMMMAGRFAGTYLMRFIAPNKLLVLFSWANIAMCLIVAQNWRWPSFIALLMINFFFSIMFPTIFTLGLKSLGKHTQKASSLIVMGVVADYDTATAYYLPILCYAVICLFAIKYFKVKFH